MIALGIVGGIGSGKSFTSAEFVARGAARFDADTEARELYKDNELLGAFRGRWPWAFGQDGALDRSALAKIIFEPSDRGRVELKFLNEILRPRLLEKLQTWLEAEKKKFRQTVILDVPLLFEAGWESLVDYIVFVDASEATRRRRIIARGWSLEELRRREALQMPLEYKKNRADFVVDADRDDSNMGRQVEHILEEIATKELSRCD